MTRILLLVVFSIAIISSASAQAPVVEWETVIGAEGSDNAINIYQLDDGGYIVGGTTQHFGGRNQDNFFIRLNADGDTLWTKAYGDSTYAENLSEFIPTSDGGYIAIGNKTSSPYPAQYLILKLDQNCDSVWAVVHGDPDVQKGAIGIVEANDEGYVFTGQCSEYNVGPQVAVIKIDSEGSIIWDHYYGLAGSDIGYCIIQADEGYMITGESPNFNDQEWNVDLFLMRLNADGDTLWTRSYGGEQEERGNCIQRASGGGYVAAGNSKSFGGGYYKDLYIVRTDINGDSLWTRAYGSVYEDVAQDIKVLPDNRGFVVAGGWHYGQWDGCLLRLDANGDSAWAVAVGGEDYEIFNAVELTDDGGYILAGQTDSYGAGGTDIYIVKLSPDPVDIYSRNQLLPNAFAISQNNPNPFNGVTQIDYQLPQDSHVNITIYNLLGQQVDILIDSNQPAGSHSVSWNSGDRQSGIYFFRITADNYTQCRKMLLLK